MVYSNKQINEAVKSGHIIIRPFNPENVAGSSVDLTIGEWYFWPGKSSENSLYNPASPSSTRDFFGKPIQAMTTREWCKQNKSKDLEGFKGDDRVIVVPPKQRFICHTQEFAGILPPGTTKLHARSSWARNGLMVRLDSGWGDPGFVNRWALQIYNTNPNHSVVIPVGDRIAQIIFMETGEVDGEYATLSGNYQKAGESVDELIKNWKPEHMLPKNYSL